MKNVKTTRVRELRFMGNLMVNDVYLVRNYGYDKSSPISLTNSPFIMSVQIKQKASYANNDSMYANQKSVVAEMYENFKSQGFISNVNADSIIVGLLGNETPLDRQVFLNVGSFISDAESEKYLEAVEILSDTGSKEYSKAVKFLGIEKVKNESSVYKFADNKGVYNLTSINKMIEIVNNGLKGKFISYKESNKPMIANSITDPETIANIKESQLVRYKDSNGELKDYVDDYGYLVYRSKHLLSLTDEIKASSNYKELPDGSFSLLADEKNIYEDGEMPEETSFSIF